MSSTMFQTTQRKTIINKFSAFIIIGARMVNSMSMVIFAMALLLHVNKLTYAATTSQIDKTPGECIAFVNNNEVTKEIGSVWVSPENPCQIYSCETDEHGQPKKVITQQNCSKVTCEKDAELRHQVGFCCGECVRTKCLHNGTAYGIGETWHNRDDCTVLECSQFDVNGGQPIISVYKKTCPPLPSDCPVQNIYEKNCCNYCRELARESNDEGKEDVWDEKFYRNHPCVRSCKADGQPMVCRYTFIVEWYETLSRACYDCPHNGTDCQRTHCIAGDGIRRSVTVVNRMMPGPAIEVCLNDTIVVDVKNHLLGESTTLHWHGMHQKDTPYMDGVPHISQCPIPPHSTFRYTFRANNAGTHFWHSHTGMQRGDGLFGAMVIRKPKEHEVHGSRYDFDLPEHKIIVQDWAHMLGISMFVAHHHSVGDNKPRNLLINGKGRYFKKILDTTNDDELFTTDPTTTMPVDESDQPTTITSSEVSPVKGYETYDIVNGSIPKKFSTKADEQPTWQRIKRSVFDVPPEKMPLARFNVKQGFRYRFRIINAEFLNCPIALSIDNHQLTVINSDGYDLEAREVASVVTYAGERFDFIVKANQNVGNYWIRFKGLMDCDERFEAAHQVAVLHYEGAPEQEPESESPNYNYNSGGIELNVMNRGSGYNDSLTIAELSAVKQDDYTDGVGREILKQEADYKFFIYYDFYPKDHPEFYSSNLYGFNASLSHYTKLFIPQLNHISLKFPAMPLLPFKDELTDSMFCNETSLAAQGIDCRKEFCKCHHVLQVPLNAVVEFIIVDEGVTYDANHPFHLHGNAFRVIGLERVGANVTIEQIKALDAAGRLRRNFNRPPIKDTVTVPDGGYTIIRFKAYNPGYWLFHCHIEFHAEIGMALVLKVGENNEMLQRPRNFPTCGDYMPEEEVENVVDDLKRRPLDSGSSIMLSNAFLFSILSLVMSIFLS